MKPMKKFIAFIFAALFAMGAWAYDGYETVNGVTWYYNCIRNGKGGYDSEITHGIAYDGSYSGNLNIPSRLGYCPVTAIGEYAFYICRSLTKITIPDSVTTIADNAFSGCSSLKSISLSGSVTSIGQNAFDGCSSLTSIELPEGVSTIGSHAFLNCSSLTAISLPHSLKSIGFDVFKGCSLIKSVTIPGRVSIMGIFPDSCSKISSVVIAEGETTIREEAFRLCESLRSVSIPDSVTMIGKYAFFACEELTSVTIPDSVTKIGRGAFWYCSKLNKVHITNVAKWCAISFDSYHANPCYYAHHLYLNGDEISNLVIPEGVTSIEPYAFYGCSSITSVAIPDSVTTIGYEAFYGCSSLTSVTIPDSVTTIEGGAFGGTSFYDAFYESQPNGFVILGKGCLYAYKGTCPSIVVIPEGVTSIGNGVFFGCWYLTSVTIPDSVTTIGSSAFKDCSSLTSITIPDSVTTIGDWAFSGCSSLTSVTLPDSVTEIGARAFYGCSSLASITIPDSVTTIGEGAFSGCSSLTSVTIPDSVKMIGKDAFAGCDKLTNVIIEPSSTLTFDSSWGIVENKIVWQCDVKVIVSNREQSYTYNCQKYQGGYKLACNCNNFDLNNIKYIGAPLPELQNVGTAKIPVENKDFEYSDRDVRFRNVVVECIDPEISITILPRSVSVTSASASKIYDGKPLTATFSIEGDGFVDGECSVSVSGSQTLVGSCKNAITLDWSEGASASNYDITFTEGDLVVLPRSVSVTSASASKIYDGKPLTTTFSIEGDGLVDGECSVSVFGSQTSVGSCKNTIALDWAEGVSVGNYNLTLTEGTLTVLPAKVSEIVKGSFDTSFTYDGEERTIDIAGVEAIKLIDTPRFAYALSETGPWSNEVPTFKDAGVHSVWYKISADNYEDYIQEAKVTILPRKVTLVSEDAEKFYDGDPLTNEAAKVAIGEFVAGDVYSLHFTGAQLDEGESENAFSVVWDGTAKASNYEVTKQYGMLKVTRLYGEVDGDSVSAKFPYSYMKMTNVSIAEGILTVDASFFSGCSSLKTIQFPGSFEKIDCHALDNIPNIGWEMRGGYKFMDGWLFGYTEEAEEEIPDIDSIRGIADGALDGCMAIRCFKCSDKALLKRIPPKAFADCGNLKEVTLPEGLEEIGDEAFIGCSEVRNFVIPGSVKSIGDRAFAYCSSLTNAQIAYGVESIGDEAFLDCWRISEVDIPSTVKNIGKDAFGGDSSIIRAGMRGDIRKISEVFSNYSNIREFIIKEGEGALKDRLFAGCGELKDVRILGDCPEMENDGQYLYANAGKTSEPITTYVTQGSYGWNGRKNSTALPQAWPLTGSYRHSIAIWDNPTYLCEFDSNGGTLGVQKTYQTSEKNFILPPEPTQSGYVFAGWWTSPVGGIHIDEKNIFIEGVYQRLYAHWIKTRTVLLDANGGTITTNAMMYVEQTTYGVLPAPVRTGYAFGGWSYNGQTIVPDTMIKTDVDHKLLAQWNAIEYTVKFDANYGTGFAADMHCVYDKLYSTPTEGFSNGSERLCGWAHFPQGEIVYKRGEAFKNLSADEGDAVTLYAIYGKGSCAELMDLWDEYGPFVPGKEIEPIDFKFAEGWKIAGLPAGLKYNAKTGLVTGKPTKSGVFKVTLTRTSDKTIAITTFEVMSAEEDKQAIMLAVGGMLPADAAVDEFAALELPVGVMVDWSIEAEALSSTTVKVAGLPAGLKLVQNKVTKAYSIQGVPTAASKIDVKTGNVVPSLAKFTITTAGKNSRVFTMPITVKAMPAWAVGTFNGGYLDDTDHPVGISTLAISATGKISGKVLVDGLTWTLTAASFGTVDEEGAYHATLTAKAGKETQEITITVDEEGVVGSGIIAYQNLWKAPDLAALGKELAVVTKNGYVAEDEIALKIAATGAVTATKTFDLGTDAKGKAVIYKASCSTTLIPMEGEDYTHIVFVYFAPNLKTGFEGYSTCLFLELAEEAYIDLAIGEALPNEETSAFEPVTLLLGKMVNWELTAEALTATTIAAAGLPSGLKIVLDKQTKEYSIQGVPNKLSKFDSQGNAIPSLVKFTVTSAGKNKRVFTMKIVVVP